MSDIELVIKIPEEKYNVIKSDLYNTFSAEMKEWGLEAIRNGEPLPKGHGRLIDADELVKEADEFELVDEDGYTLIYEADIYNAPTIIEADRNEEK